MARDNDTFLSNPIWERGKTGYAKHNTMSRQLYLLMVCFWTAAGIVVSAITSTFSQNLPIHSWNQWELIGFFVGILLVSLLGVWIAQSSDSPSVSLFGYTILTVAFGVMLGPVVALYETSSVIKILAVTAGVVIVLGLVGAMIPDDLSIWGLWLFGGLLFLIGGLIIVPILGHFGLDVRGAMTALDWIGIVIFGGLVIFDLNRAVRLPYTANNAIDSAVAIYLDFINIFIRLLSLMGKKK